MLVGLPGVVGAEASEQTCDVPVCNLVPLARILDMHVHLKNIRYIHMGIGQNCWTPSMDGLNTKHDKKLWVYRRPKFDPYPYLVAAPLRFCHFQPRLLWHWNWCIPWPKGRLHRPKLSTSASRCQQAGENWSHVLCFWSSKISKVARSHLPGLCPRGRWSTAVNLEHGKLWLWNTTIIEQSLGIISQARIQIEHELTKAGKMKGRGRQRLPCKVLTEVKMTNIAQITEGWSLTSPDTKISPHFPVSKYVQIHPLNLKAWKALAPGGVLFGDDWLLPEDDAFTDMSRLSRLQVVVGGCSTRELLLYRAPLSLL